MCCAVLGSEQKHKGIRLSLLPSAVNHGCDASLVKKGRVIWAAISSVEDRGCILDVGIAGVTVFVPTAETVALVASQGGKALVAGTPLFCLIMADESRALQASIDPSKIVTARLQAKNHPTIQTLVPGLLVDCQVDATTETALEVSFNGFKGTIDRRYSKLLSN